MSNEDRQRARDAAARALDDLGEARCPVIIRPSWLDRGLYDWQMLWRVLASPRCRPLYGELGLPTPIVENSELVRPVAEVIWTAGWYPPAAPPHTAPSGYESILRLHRIHVIERFFAALALRYDRQTAEALAEWAHNVFADRAEEHRWHRWHTLLIYLTNANGRGGPAVPAPLDAERSAVILHWIRTRLRYERDEPRNRIREQLAEPGTAWEHSVDQLLSNAMGERVTDAGLATWLSLRMAAASAFGIWHELKGTLSAIEFADIWAWGREEAAATGVGDPEKYPPVYTDGRARACDGRLLDPPAPEQAALGWEEAARLHTTGESFVAEVIGWCRRGLIVGMGAHALAPIRELVEFRGRRTGIQDRLRARCGEYLRLRVIGLDAQLGRILVSERDRADADEAQRRGDS